MDIQTNKITTPSGEEIHDPFVKPKVASEVGKYTPLHWASYKGFYKVVWILLKQEMTPLDIDQHGNTAVHQASASGNKKVLECFLSRGIDVDIKNARGHTPLDLAVGDEVKNLIKKAIQTKNCKDPTCNSKFTFKNIRYYCESCEQFYCKNSSETYWVYETKDSEDQERPVCRCQTCSKSIKKQEDNLRSAMKTMNYQTVDNSIRQINENNIDIEDLSAVPTNLEDIFLKMMRENASNNQTC